MNQVKPLSRPKRQDPVKARSNLLQAALEEFSARGYDAATMRDIGARVGMSHGSIRYHYESKEKLWFTAVDFLFDRLKREVGLSEDEFALLAAGDLEIFRTFLRNYVKYCAKHPEHARIMMQEAVSPTSRLQVIASRYLRRSHKDGMHIMKMLIEKGALPTCAQPESMIYIITASCQNIFALASEAEMALDYDAHSDEAVYAHAETIVQLFCPS